MRYASVWQRFLALCLDSLFLSPLACLVYWGGANYRLFELYYLIPGIALSYLYYVYLVKRLGGTPGKRFMGLLVRKVNGEPVTCREAFLRYFPGWGVALSSSIALMISALQLTDAQYFAASSAVARSQLLKSLAPAWYEPLQWGATAWVFAEVIVMLANYERRTLHDFIAGTVVVKEVGVAGVEACCADTPA